jgi:hypothetical protein
VGGFAPNIHKSEEVTRAAPTSAWTSPPPSSTSTANAISILKIPSQTRSSGSRGISKKGTPTPSAWRRDCFLLKKIGSITESINGQRERLGDHGLAQIRRNGRHFYRRSSRGALYRTDKDRSPLELRALGQIQPDRCVSRISWGRRSSTSESPSATHEGRDS